MLNVQADFKRASSAVKPLDKGSNDTVLASSKQAAENPEKTGSGQSRLAKKFSLRDRATIVENVLQEWDVG